MSIPLSYESQAYPSIAQPFNSLLVLSRGLGLLSIQAYALTQVLSAPVRPLILLINYKDEEIAALRRANLVITSVEEEKVAKGGRRTCYTQKGLVAFSSKMVVVDLLEEVLDAKDVTFIFINNISRLSNSSNERFLADLCMSRNPACYMKLFSERPEQLPSLFDTLSRTFYIQQTDVWPRTRTEVEESLVIEKTQTTQVVLRPTRGVVKIQEMLGRLCVEAINEIKRLNPHRGMEGLTLEACLLHRHRSILKQSIDTKLKNLTSSTLILLENIDEIVSLLSLLDSADGALLYLSFLQILDRNRDTEGSIWLNTPRPEEIDELQRGIRGLCVSVKGDGGVVGVNKAPRKWVELGKTVEMCCKEGQWGSVLIYVDGLVEELQSYLVTAKMKAGELVADLHLKVLLESYQSAVLRPEERTEETARNLEKLKAELQAQFSLSQEQAHSLDSKRSHSQLSPPLNVSLLESLGYSWSSEYSPGWRVTFNDTFDPFALELEAPTHIILFSPQVAIIREIERYVARLELMDQPQPKEIVIISSETSAESRVFDYVNRSEDRAFGEIKRMMEVRGRQMKTVYVRSGEDLEGGGGDGRNAGRAESRTIVVDKREFGCNLPYELHKSGFTILPETLTIGDYVLSSDICIERKSSNSDDIWQSLQSGRLLDQLRRMTSYYSRCVLLLEFREGTVRGRQAFNLAGKTAGYSEKYNISAKLGEVAMQFPRLSLVWSRSVCETVRIFQRLKTGQAEPIPGEVREYGKETISTHSNLFGQNLLRSFPGVNEHNLAPLMRRFGTLEGIAGARLEDLIEVMGEEAAKALTKFLDEKHVPTQTQLN